MSAALEAPGVALTAERLIALRHLAIHEEGELQLSALPGGFMTKNRGHGQEMVDVREYVEGDDIRHLDRGSTARTGTLHIRTFQEERDRVTFLVADFRPAMLWGLKRAFRSVAAAEALCLIGWRVVEEGGRVGLLALTAGDPVIVPVRGRARGMLGVIGGLVTAHDAALQLALAGESRDPPLGTGLMRLMRIAPRGSELVVASGFDARGEALSERLSELAQTRTLRLLSISDGLTKALPPGTYPMRLSDGRRARARIVKITGSAPAKGMLSDQPVLTLDASASVDETARRLNCAFYSLKAA